MHEFVDALLDDAAGDPARRFADELYAGGHRFLVTRSLTIAKSYVRERYAEAPTARYGILASSKDKVLVGHGIDNTFQTTKRLRVGPWYNAPSTDQRSACQMTSVATEFAAQGLELEFVVLAWGSDFLREQQRWSIRLSRGSRGAIRDPQGMRRNVYRVLLTRGRDGTVVFVPTDPIFDETHEYLLSCGFRSLDNR